MSLYDASSCNTPLFNSDGYEHELVQKGKVAVNFIFVENERYNTIFYLRWYTKLNINDIIRDFKTKHKKSCISTKKQTFLIALFRYSATFNGNFSLGIIYYCLHNAHCTMAYFNGISMMFWNILIFLISKRYTRKP